MEDLDFQQLKQYLDRDGFVVPGGYLSVPRGAHRPDAVAL